MTRLTAEVISIGDELTCGHRLDTNGQWISEQLTDMGIHVAFHTTVGDNLRDNLQVFQTAITRADLIVSTGGLGPTEDDLTREVLARTAGVELALDPPSLDHIKAIFKSFSREMPEQNELQAYLPVGSNGIFNPHGTAPGIDFSIEVDGGSARVIALPGVPAEMKEMWESTVAKSVLPRDENTPTTRHFTLHCFGAGESEIASMISAEILQRGRDPLVGITASQATISLRISATGVNELDCRQKMAPTISTLRANLGPLIFGENGEQLQDILVSKLVEDHRRLVVVDLAFDGLLFQMLKEADKEQNVVPVGIELSTDAAILRFLNDKTDRGEALGSSSDVLEKLAQHAKQAFHTELALVVGRLPEVPADAGPQNRQQFFKTALATGESIGTQKHAFVGHPSYRHIRAIKQVLNMMRLD